MIILGVLDILDFKIIARQDGGDRIKEDETFLVLEVKAGGAHHEKCPAGDLLEPEDLYRSGDGRFVLSAVEINIVADVIIEKAFDICFNLLGKDRRGNSENDGDSDQN